MSEMQSERLRLGKLRNEGITRELHALHNKNFKIKTIRIRFVSAPTIYQIEGTNEMHQERAWDTRREMYDRHIQEWLVGAYRGNTRSPKRKKDLGWRLIGFWDRGANGFLHCHGFVAFYIGIGNALSYEEEVTMRRLQEKEYDKVVNDVYLDAWYGPDSNAVAYANKGSWRANSRNDVVYAAAGGGI